MGKMSAQEIADRFETMFSAIAHEPVSVTTAEFYRGNVRAIAETVEGRDRIIRAHAAIKAAGYGVGEVVSTRGRAVCFAIVP